MDIRELNAQMDAARKAICEALDAHGGIDPNNQAVVLAGIELFLMRATSLFGVEAVRKLCQRMGQFNAQDNLPLSVSTRIH